MTFNSTGDLIMCKISMSLVRPIYNLKLISLISKITGLSLISVKEKFSEGREGVFYTTELFLNDHVEKDKEIRKIVKEFECENIELFVMEIGFDQCWSEVEDFNEHKISSTELIQILDNCGDFH